MNTRKSITKTMVVAFFILTVLLMCHIAFAAQNLPWEEPLTKIQKSITGPVALVVSLVAIVAVGITLIFGGDMQGFIRQICYVVLVVGIIVSANSLLSALGFTTSGSAFILL